MTIMKSVIVEAPVRFAIIAPGVPAPKVIISSSEQVSDIIGYYSIRESGLGDVISDDRFVDSRSLFLNILSGSNAAIDPYISFDTWINYEPDNRKQLYSLIINTPGLSRHAIRSFADISDKMEAQVQRVVKAYTNNNHDELIYLSQMLATFVNLFVSKLDAESDRLKARRKALSGLLTAYISVLGAVIAVAAVLFASGTDPLHISELVRQSNVAK